MKTLKVKERSGIVGNVTIAVYRAGMVEAVTPHLDKIRKFRDLINAGASATLYGPRIAAYMEIVEEIKAHFFLKTAAEFRNLVVQSPNYGLDLLIQRLAGTTTYTGVIGYIEIGTGATTPTLADTALTTPFMRVPVNFQQDYGAMSAIVQSFISDSQLTNGTYTEVGSFVGGTATIGSGQMFNHALISPSYVKASGTDTTIQIEFSFANA